MRCRASKPINPAPALVFLGHPLWQRRRASEYDTLHVVGELERPHTLGRVVSQEEALAGPMRSCTCGSGCTCAHARHSCRGICTTSVGTEVVSDGGESAHCKSWRTPFRHGEKPAAAHLPRRRRHVEWRPRRAFLPPLVRGRAPRRVRTKKRYSRKIVSFRQAGERHPCRWWERRQRPSKTLTQRMDFSKTRVSFWSATQMTKVVRHSASGAPAATRLGSLGTQRVAGRGKQNGYGPKVVDDKMSRYLPESQHALGPGFPRHSRDEAAMDVAATTVRQTWLQRHQRGKEMHACGNAREKLTSWRDRLHYENERLPPMVPEKPASCEYICSQ